jgi:hypothetical protein
MHREALELEVAADKIGEDESAEIADMGEIIDRRPAAIEADVSAGRVERNEFLHRARQSIKQTQSHRLAM